MNSFINDINEKGYLVLDGLLPTNFTNHVYKLFTSQEIWGGIGNPTVSYSSTNQILSPNCPAIQHQFEAPQLTCTIYHESGDNRRPFLYDNIQVMLDSISRCYDYQFYFSPIRFKANLQQRYPRKENQLYNTPHIDHTTPNDGTYFTIIYYVNDSDGETFLFKESYLGDVKDNLNLDIKIVPKQGRFVIFPVERIHTGSHPVNNDFRIVLNLNVKMHSLL